jgi:hypothetical protein
MNGKGCGPLLESIQSNTETDDACTGSIETVNPVAHHMEASHKMPTIKNTASNPFAFMGIRSMGAPNASDDLKFTYNLVQFSPARRISV